MFTYEVCCIFNYEECLAEVCWYVWLKVMFSQGMLVCLGTRYVNMFSYLAEVCWFV